jgi:ubiquinone/menaquinone biosynthesis C-methylase UbiE
MSTDCQISKYYEQGDLLTRIKAALKEDGGDPDHPTIEGLAPYDQFHGRGIEATAQIADLILAGPTDHLLDIGSGLGGPARYFATRFGCKVTGIDLTPEFCDVARHFTDVLGLHERVSFEVGNALSMPFAEDHFNGAYSMNVSMNIGDKDLFYREIHRVLKPDAWLVLSEFAKGDGKEVDYPTPWAHSACTSFLSTPNEICQGLLEAGFDVVKLENTREEALAFATRSREMVKRGEKPPHRAVLLIHAEIAREAIANSHRGLLEGRIIPIEVLCQKRRSL